MTVKDELKNNASFKFEEGVFYQNDLVRNNTFEQRYLALRNIEGRFYSDDIVRSLPNIPAGHPLEYEWKVRDTSAKKLISYLKQRPYSRILEVGCGNGWLSNKLAFNLSANVIAIDINEAELLQGARIFSNDRLSFIYGDVLRCDLNDQEFDAIILASSIQYFKDVRGLIRRLLNLLTSSGEIHIIDSPIYSSQNEIPNARKRSLNHFTSSGFPEMADHYFHHTKQDIDIFNYVILNDLESVGSAIKRLIFKKSNSIFPWIKIESVSRENA